MSSPSTSYTKNIVAIAKYMVATVKYMVAIAKYMDGGYCRVHCVIFKVHGGIVKYMLSDVIAKSLIVNT